MRNQMGLLARVAGPVALCALLAACGQAGQTPPPGGSAGAMGANASSGGQNSKSSSDQESPANESDNPDNTDDDSNADGSNDSTSDSPQLKVPDGTLTYTIVFTGHDDTDTPEKHDWFDVSRRIQVTSRLRGSAGNLTPPPRDTMQGKLQACGDDAACQQSVVMNTMADPSVAKRDRQRMKGWLGRDRVWVQLDGPCHGTASVNDKGDNHWKGWDTELNGRVSWQGTETFDCSHVQPDINFDDLKLAARMDTHTYTLTLPGFAMDARYVFGDKAPTTRSASFPPVVVKDVKFTALDEPLHGSVTLHSGDDGNELFNPDAPLTAKVDWTFTPDAK